MIEFQNDEEKRVWRENLLPWQGMLEQGFEMADKVVLAYRDRCPKNSLNLNCTMHFDPPPLNFCDVKPFPVADIRIVSRNGGDEAANKQEDNNDGE